MTPPDAMSWNEAVAALEEAIHSACNDDDFTLRDLLDARKALAAIQSHRVQAEALADAAEAAVERSVRVLGRGDPKRLTAEGEEVRDRLEAAVAAYRNTDAALAAATNNDGGEK